MLRHEHSGKKEKAEKRIGGGVGGETSYNRNEDEEAKWKDNRTLTKSQNSIRVLFFFLKM